MELKFSQVKKLCKALGAEASELTIKGDEIEWGNETILILTDDEANDRLKERISEDLWAFNADFIASHTKNGLSRKGVDALRKMQGELCEDASEIVEALIEDMDHFVQDAVSSDGRGHFLSSYDGEEIELGGDLFAYRN